MSDLSPEDWDIQRRIIRKDTIRYLIEYLTEIEDKLNQHNSPDASSEVQEILRKVMRQCDY